MITNIYGNDNGLTKEPDRVYVNIGGQSVELWEKPEPRGPYDWVLGDPIFPFDAVTINWSSYVDPGMYLTENGFCNNSSNDFYFRYTPKVQVKNGDKISFHFKTLQVTTNATRRLFMGYYPNLYNYEMCPIVGYNENYNHTDVWKTITFGDSNNSISGQGKDYSTTSINVGLSASGSGANISVLWYIDKIIWTFS